MIGRRAAIGLAGVAAVVAIGVPLGLTQGTGSIDVFVGSTPTPIVTPEPDLFNVGVTTGTCDSTPTRLSTPVEAASVPSTSLACTLDQAWDVMTDGDKAIIKAGTYAEQVVNGNRTAATYLIGAGDGDDVLIGDGGAGADCVSSWSAMCADGNFMTLENVTTVVTDPGPAGGLAVNGVNVTVRDFHTKGGVNGAALWPSSIGVHATGFLFDGGSIGRTDAVEEALCTHSTIEPVWLQSGGDNATVQYVTVGLYDAIVGAGPSCGGDNVPHIETIRFEDADNVTFRGNTFSGPSDAGSGHIFTSSDPDGATFVNNVFEDRGIANPWATLSGTPSSWTWLYNSFLDDGGRSGSVDTAEVFAGNFGYSPGCGTTDVKNVYAGSGSCGTSTYIGAAAFGLDASNHVEAGSPAIDAAETPGASDYCTDTVVNSLDLDKDPRPFGGTGNCTAGADEPTS